MIIMTFYVELFLLTIIIRNIVLIATLHNSTKQAVFKNVENIYSI